MLFLALYRDQRWKMCITFGEVLSLWSYHTSLYVTKAKQLNWEVASVIISMSLAVTKRLYKGTIFVSHGRNEGAENIEYKSL